MSNVYKIRYTSFENAQGHVLMRPYVSMTLVYGPNQIPYSGLLDTGADVNVLPYELGLEMGAIWEEQKNRFTLSGNLAGYEARGIILTSAVERFSPVKLAFAWIKAPNIPLILGRTNFLWSLVSASLHLRTCFKSNLNNPKASDFSEALRSPTPP